VNQPYPPLIAVPDGLCDTDAAALLDFLYELAAAIENHYAGQLHRHHHADQDDSQLSLLDDPPF
jgi:hypothetical protein